MNLGKPVDIEEDIFYVAEWDTLVDDKSVFFPWVMFYNFTGGSPTSLDFTFDPPKDAGGTSFVLNVVLQDSNPKLPKSETFQIAV